MDEANFMTYNGNHLFHFTSLDCACKIIISKQLKFGKFENVNDIAEIKREFFSNVEEDIILKELDKFQFISLTRDKRYKRGFEIDPLWGHYAIKGNGVCLVFDKKKLINFFKSTYKKQCWCGPIKYLKHHTNAKFGGNFAKDNIVSEIIRDRKDIFFNKAIDWSYEQEYRLLIRKEDEAFMPLNDALLAVILCLPKVSDDNYKKTHEFMLLKMICDSTPILHYTTGFGNKEVLDENGEKVWPIYMA